MGLNGEFAARIAHQIREQIQYHQREAAGARVGKFFDYGLLKKSTRSLIELTSANPDLKNHLQGSIVT
jgi:hypothetical protein